MQKLILLTEKSEDLYKTHSKIGKLFINRLLIDEQASFELMTCLELQISSDKIGDVDHDEYPDYEYKRKEKEVFDSEVLENAIQLVSLSQPDLKPHFIYAGEYYLLDVFSQLTPTLEDIRSKIIEFIVLKMEEYNVRDAMLTFLFMERLHLVTKETMKERSHFHSFRFPSLNHLIARNFLQRDFSKNAISYHEGTL